MLGALASLGVLRPAKAKWGRASETCMAQFSAMKLISIQDIQGVDDTQDMEDAQDTEGIQYT